MILSTALTQAALKNGNHPAILELGKSISYAELRKRVGQLSYLYQSEIPAGERIGLLGSNSTAFAQTFFALTNISNPIFIIDPALTDDEVAKDLKNLEIKTILISSDQNYRIRELTRAQGLSLNTIEFEKKRGGEYDPAYMPPPERPLKEIDTVIILRNAEYGEETKYISFNHKQVYLAVSAIKKFYRLTPNDKILTKMNWGHPFALIHGMLLPLFTGSVCAIDPDSPSVEEFVEYIAQKSITRFIGPPKFFFQLLTWCASQKYMLPGVKSITVGMGSLSLSLRKTFKLLNIPVLRCYGRNEFVWPIAMDEVETALDIENAKSKPAQGVKCKVLNESGDEIEGDAKREGPLAVTAEYAMNSFYHPDKDLAAEATRHRVRGTWIYTGEIARLEGEGEDLTIAVLGKAIDMIKTSSGYLSPRPIDDAAKSVTGIADAAGFVKFNNKGEPSFSCAVVYEAKPLNDSDVFRKISELLPSNIVPKSIHQVDFIPRDTFDSVNRTALQRQFSGM
ncbi:MAG: acyl--CoA ligase [Oligoflexia bacterium]|nr:acyl--CoA ligase [Oligoflexia bacterium]